MRKLGIAILVIVVLAIAGILIVPHLIDINKYHGQIQAQLQKKLGRQVSLGEMKLSVFPLSFQVADPVIAEDKNFDTGSPFATAQRLVVSVRLLPLLHKDVDIKSLELDQPHIELIRNAQGQWNFSRLGQEPMESPAQQNPQPENKKPAGELTLAKLNINDGQLAVTDLQKHQSRAVYDHIDLSIRDFAPNQEFSLKLAAHLPGQGRETVSLEGKGGPIRQSDLLTTNFDGGLRLDQVSIAGVEKFLNSQALNDIEGQMSGDAKVKNTEGKLASGGSIRLEDARIHNVNAGYPITLDYDVTDDLNSDVIQIHRANLKLGSTPITIAGTVNSKPTPAQIDVKLTATNAPIGEIARLASAFGVAFGRGMTVNGNVNADMQAKGDATKPSMNGHLTARDLSISGDGLPQPVKINAVELAITPDIIRSNDFTASTGSTSVTANMALAHYRAANSSIDASLQATNAKVSELLNMAKAYGVSALEGISGDGLLSLNVRAHGPMKDANAVIFSGSGKLQNATLKLPSLAKPVQIHNTDLSFSQNAANLQNLTASIGQTNANGWLTLNTFAEPQVQFTLNADKVNVIELQQMMNAMPAPAKKATHDFWRLVPKVNAQAAKANEPSMLNKLTGGGTVAIGTVQYDDLVLTNVHSNVSLEHGLILLNPLTSQLYGGQESGSVTIDMRAAQPVYSANLKTDKVDANKLISSVSSVKEMIYGLLASNVNVSFTSSGSADSIARELNGALGINLTNGKLANLDMLHELGSVAKFMGMPNASKGFTTLTQLSGDFNVKKGVAQTNNLKAVIDGGTLAAAGLVNLVDQSLNLHVTAVLAKAMSQQVGGSQIGGFMNTALANNQGELVIPVLVTGTFQHPQVVPDVEQVAQMKLKNLLPTSGNPGALTSGIVGAITGKNKGGLEGILGALAGQQRQNQQQNNGVADKNASQQQPPQNQNPLGDVLDKVLGGKKKQPPK